MSRSISYRIVALQVLTLVLILAPFVAGAAFVWAKHKSYESRLAEWEPRHARLQGIMQQQPDLISHTQLADSLMAAYAYPAASEATQNVNDAQQRIRTALEQGGLRVESINVSAPAQEGAFVRYRIVSRMDGNINTLQRALLVLREQMPVLVVDSIRITNEGPMVRAAVQRLTAQIEFSILKAKP
jgi:general secretion pathway protein M